MTQEEFDGILAAIPPWITEDTLQRLAGAGNQTNVNLVRIAQTLVKAGKQKTKAEDVDDEADKVKSKAKKSAAKTEKYLKKGKQTMNAVMADSDPASAVAELTHEASKLLANVGTGLTNAIPGGGKVQKVMSFASSTVGKGAVIATGMGVIFAKLLTEQEKDVRALIGVGAITNDLQGYTTLRRQVSALGMSLKDFKDIGEYAKPLLLSAESDTFKGQVSLTRFLDDIDKDTSFRDFGMGIQDQSRILAQEAETLYELGQITDLSNGSKRKVIESYEQANKMALFMASGLGMQRDEAMALRDTARKEIGFRSAMIQNGEKIKEIYGEEAEKNIAQNQGLMAMLMGPTLGEEFSKATQEAMTMAIHEFDQGDFSVANNIPEDLARSLNSMGILEDYIAMLDNMINDRTDGGADAYKQYTSFLTKMRSTDPIPAGFDASIQKRNQMIAEALQIPDNFFRQDPQIFEDPDYLAKTADQADTTIDTLDNMAVAFKSMQTTLLPGYKTTGKGFDTLSKGLMGMGRAISERLNLGDRFQEVYIQQVKTQITEEMAKVNEGNVDAYILQTTLAKSEMTETGQSLTEMLDADFRDDDGKEITQETRDAIKSELQSLAQQVFDQELLLTELLRKQVEVYQHKSTMETEAAH